MIKKLLFYLLLINFAFSSNIFILFDRSFSSFNIVYSSSVSSKLKKVLFYNHNRFISLSSLSYYLSSFKLDYRLVNNNIIIVPSYVRPFNVRISFEKFDSFKKLVSHFNLYYSYPFLYATNYQFYSLVYPVLPYYSKNFDFNLLILHRPTRPTDEDDLGGRGGRGDN